MNSTEKFEIYIAGLLHGMIDTILTKERVDIIITQIDDMLHEINRKEIEGIE